jgi:hypothetical protein
VALTVRIDSDHCHGILKNTFKQLSDAGSVAFNNRWPALRAPAPYAPSPPPRRWVGSR